ncbi:hypothetical protein CDAR_394141 [Caerostris darwini]|uniref:Uncharacterized protein n=1 Tax=Caerostris darwini TaxID=1538125 RepID=A0AAV4RIJ1_9ARAC|nr:hypothetical protein CDAR_394141 [Caerostris darwini]
MLVTDGGTGSKKGWLLLKKGGTGNALPSGGVEWGAESSAPGKRSERKDFADLSIEKLDWVSSKTSSDFDETNPRFLCSKSNRVVEGTKPVSLYNLCCYRCQCLQRCRASQDTCCDAREVIVYRSGEQEESRRPKKE